MVFTAGLMGWAGIDLNFSTVTVFSISLGIAVDTTIHYLSRLRVELRRDPDPTVAMHRAVRGAGGPMIFGTLLLVLGFGAILTSNFRFTFHFGLLGGFALIAALLCDLFVTPTLFRAFGSRVERSGSTAPGRAL
jgi:predicted RND superfamily exporter protein